MGDRDENTQSEFPSVNPEHDESTSSKDFQVFSGNEDAGDTGKRIGRYRLIRPVGQGGMGVVWRAIQEHPVRREVALKLIGSNLGKEAIGRFEAERQAIAMMDHPNIAKILDADTTESGRPYFVMELVKGIPLDQYCNNRKLGIEERLRLMIPVCRAVQHAHQKAIIHRDLKHSNILVADSDNEATPKVIDFGLAKALGSQKSLTDKTVYTEYGKVVGTIHYMSPEQADSDGIDIDTRSDIYSLGVVMYKLLTGRTPIQVNNEGLSIVGAIKAIRQEEAIEPSVAIRKNEDCAEWVEDNSNLTSTKFSDQLKGDIDAIVLKALEKDRRSRYETANGLAMDIERYLNNEPVNAQQRNSMYALRKFMKRNKGLVASLATIAALLVGGIVATTLAMLAANRETVRANDNAEIAKSETKRANIEADRAIEAEKLKSTQLKAQLHKSAWSDWKGTSIETAWQSLKQIDPQDRDWVTRYLANEMYTTKPSNSLNGHAHYVLSIDVSSNGNYILSGGADDVVYLWNAFTNKQIYRRVFDDIVVCVRFSGDHSHFAVADRSNVVSVFETKSGKRVKKLGPYEEDVSSLAFHPTKSILAMGFFGNDSYREFTTRPRKFSEDRPPDLMVVEFLTGKELQTVQGHEKEITSLAFDEDGNRLVSGSMDGNLRIWELKSSEDESSIDVALLRKIKAHPSGIRKIDVADGEPLVVCGGQDKIASLWNFDTGELVAQFAGHRNEILGVDLSPNGKLVATSSNDQTMIVWDLDGNAIVKWQGHSAGGDEAAAINAVCFTADSQRVITASDDQTMRSWPARKPATTVFCNLNEIDENIESAWCADFSPDASMIATASQSGEVFIVDAKTGEIKRRISNEGDVYGLSWLSDGRLLAGVSGDVHASISIWNRPDRPGPLSKPSRTIKIEPCEIWGVAVSPNEELLALGCSDNVARIYETTAFELVGTLVGHTDTVATVEFSPDGKQLVTGSDDRNVKLWDAETFTELKTFSGHKLPIWRAVFSPIDSNLIASSSSDGKILLWDAKNGVQLQSNIEGHSADVAGLAFSPDGKSLVSASDDGTVRFWDIKTGVELFVFQEQPAQAVMHVSWSKDGQSLVATGVSLVAIRHAASNFVSPDLAGDAHALETDAEETVDEDEISEDKLSKDELKKLISDSKTICDRYPSHVSWKVYGIGLYKSGRFEDAVEPLEEAMRLEKIRYGYSDYRPFIEAYLAMSLAKSGNINRAKQIADLFESEAADWEGDPKVDSLQEKVKAVIGD